MNITPGPPVTQDDFFDREDLIETVWEVLGQHSVLLAAPRRVGKSSLMLKLFQEPRAGFEPVWLDGQDYDGPEDLVADLAVQLAKLRGKGFLGKFLSKVVANLEELEVWELKVKLRQQLPGSWRDQGETVLRDALKPDTKLLIVIDELPILLHKLIAAGNDQGKKSAQNLLDWLRHLRQAPGFFTQVRQMLGGSVGLPRIASLIGSSAKINDLRSVPVGPFERPQAKQLATLLLRSREVELEPEVMEAFLDQIGTLLPIFIQILASVVAAEVRKRKQPATADLIRECYEERALGPEFRICFEDYYERLDRYYSPDEARVARVILRDLAIAKSPLLKSSLLGTYHKELGQTAEASKFDLLLTWLSDDFYVEEISEGRVQFKSRWMRDWWRTYHASKP
jgi:hypothetical protein